MKKIKIKYIYSEKEINYFDIKISRNSVFDEEMLEDIESWLLPESFLWVNIVQPEIFKVWNLQWEQIDRTWWVREYKNI